jgi:hypothetical protein
MGDSSAPRWAVQFRCGAQNGCPWASWLTITGFGPSAMTGISRGGGVVRFLAWAIAAAFRPRVRLIAENLCLRQQLLVLKRRHPQPRLGNADRRFWIIACRWFSSWRGSLLIVKPETVLRWHRRGWRAYWSWRSRRQPGRSGRHPIPQELQALIPTDDRRKSALGSKADPGRTSETGVYGFCEDCRKVYEFATHSRAILGLAKILEAP